MFISVSQFSFVSIVTFLEAKRAWLTKTFLGKHWYKLKKEGWLASKETRRRQERIIV
jgi:hypothetical protein